MLNSRGFVCKNNPLFRIGEDVSQLSMYHGVLVETEQTTFWLIIFNVKYTLID